MAVKVEDFRMTKLTRDDLAEGVTLIYRGDHVPYVQAKNLITKGQKNGGKYLLPAFTKNDALPAGIEWMDIPGSTSDTYTIKSVTRNRVSKRGQALPDQVYITGSGYAMGVTFALNELDVIAKFALRSVIDEAAIDIAVNDRAAEILSLSAWKEQVMSEGW